MMNKPRVYVTIEDGLVQDVWGDVEVDVVILDFDTEGGDERNMMNISDDQAYVSEHLPCRVDVAECDRVDAAIVEQSP